MNELYYILQEECGEVIQAVSKILRFGYDDEYKGVKNSTRLTEEIGDLLAMIYLLEENDLIDLEEVLRCSERKFEKLEKWSNIKRKKR